MPQRIFKMQAEIGAEVARATPPAVVAAGAVVGSWDINHVVGAATVAYIGLQAAYLIWKWWCDAQRRRAEMKGEAP